MPLEKVSFVPDPNGSGECVPQITIDDGDGGAGASRPFEAEDMGRVLDFDVVPASPPDGPLRKLERRTGGFPSRHFALRGGYLFYFDEESVDNDPSPEGRDGGLGRGGGVGQPQGGGAYLDPPLGVIPLERTAVEFPPGGRRVFQEHARTDAARGYEFVIRHVPPKAKGAGAEQNGDAAAAAEQQQQRGDAYLVADTLTQREGWAAALRVRAELIKRDTTLRAGSGSGKTAAAVAGGAAGESRPARGEAAAVAGGGPPTSAPHRPSLASATGAGGMGAPLGAGAGPGHGHGHGEATNSLSAIAEDTQSLMQDGVLKQFTHPRFRDVDWIDDFFSAHNEFESEQTCQQLESTQLAVKRGLRGAVLEQYKYFVEASREMTTMGREVSSLKRLVESQAEAIDKMKNINFADAFADPVLEEDAYYSSSDDEGDDDDDSLALSVASSQSSQDDYSTGAGNAHKKGGAPSSSSGRGRQRDREDAAARVPGGPGPGPGRGFASESSGEMGNDNDEDNPTSLIEVPPWLGDSTEEISSFIKECRFTEATDLILKAKAEVADILNQHDKPTERKLSRKQHTSIQRILLEIENLTSLMGDRLAETLRRKNEALKQACKRERADPNYEMAPLLSPSCINDDATALQLLVKLGRSKDAAVAYSTRRSLQLSESLNERAIASSGSVTSDTVIYASQLSQSFFSCLAMAVEGFLDLYLGGDTGLSANDAEDGSLNSVANKKVPAGALASIVLWCDTELAKFAHTFGGQRVLGRLSLSPSSSSSATASSDQSLQDSLSSKRDGASIGELRKQLRAAEEAGDYALAGSLRRKLTSAEESQRKSDRSRSSRDDSSRGSRGSRVDKERQLGVDVAAKCVEQAFNFASESLDSIGLPLTPRLAECMRSRLKGCEVEIAVLLGEKWHHIVSDWHVSRDTDSRRSGRGPTRRTRLNKGESEMSSISNGTR